MEKELLAEIKRQIERKQLEILYKKYLDKMLLKEGLSKANIDKVTENPKFIYWLISGGKHLYRYYDMPINEFQERVVREGKVDLLEKQLKAIKEAIKNNMIADGDKKLDLIAVLTRFMNRIVALENESVSDLESKFGKNSAKISCSELLKERRAQLEESNYSFSFGTSNYQTYPAPGKEKHSQKGYTRTSDFQDGTKDFGGNVK